MAEHYPPEGACIKNWDDLLRELKKNMDSLILIWAFMNGDLPCKIDVVRDQL